MEAPSHESAMSTVLDIAELREAILIAYGNTHVEQNEVSRPAEQLFPLQRVDHAFAATIRRSPTLRNMMCLGDETSMDSLRWFLRTLNKNLEAQCLPLDKKNLEAQSIPQNIKLYSSFASHEGEVWADLMTPKSWQHKDASWRSIKWGDADRSEEEETPLQLYFAVLPEREECFPGVCTLELDMDILPTLGDVYDSIREIVVNFQDQVNCTERERAAKTGQDMRPVAGSILHKIDFHSDSQWPPVELEWEFREW